MTRKVKEINKCEIRSLEGQVCRWRPKHQLMCSNVIKTKFPMKKNVVTLMSTLFTLLHLSIHPAWCLRQTQAPHHIFMDALVAYKATVKVRVYYRRRATYRRAEAEANSHMRTSTLLCKTNYNSSMKLMSWKMREWMIEWMAGRVSNCMSARRTWGCKTPIRIHLNRFHNIRNNTGIVTWTISQMRPMKTSVEISQRLVEFLPKELEVETSTTNTKCSFNKCFSKACKQEATFWYRQKTIN